MKEWAVVKTHNNIPTVFIGSRAIIDSCFIENAKESARRINDALKTAVPRELAEKMAEAIKRARWWSGPFMGNEVRFQKDMEFTDEALARFRAWEEGK